MAENKKSIWSTIILVCTIVTLILLVASIVATAVGLPAVLEEAKAAAIAQGVTPEEANLAATIAVGIVVVVLVFSSLIDIFKIIGGFLFSLKGRWGVFCIVVAILSILSGVWGLVNNITNKAGGLTIAFTAIGLAVSVLFCVACFKHLQENKA